MSQNKLPAFQHLIAEIQSGEHSATMEHVDQFWASMLPCLEEDMQGAKQHLMEFAAGVIDSPDNEDSLFSTLGEPYVAFTRALINADTIPEIKVQYDRFFQQAVSCFNRYSSDLCFQKINQVQSYMQAHLDEDLSLKLVSDLFYLNASYLSRLFREKTGMTFSDYLADIRIARAKDLLITTSDSIISISQKVGYKEANSFSRLFKKCTGMSPQKFRNINHTNTRDSIPIPGGDFDMGPCIFSQGDLAYADSYLNRS